MSDREIVKQITRELIEKSDERYRIGAERYFREGIVLHGVRGPEMHDMVQKGYGWMLKEAAKRFPKEVFEFVMERKGTMPRTALRYAIEKYPQEMRKRVMEK